MRLGYFSVSTPADLERIVPGLDQYGLSAAWVSGLETKSAGECEALANKAQTLGVVLGEVGMWANLMTGNSDLRRARIEEVRTLLRQADAAQVKCVVTLAGSRDRSDHSLAPHPYMYSKEAQAEFREIVLRILDGLDLKHTRYGVEPWHNTFFYQPEDIRAFIDRVGHPRFGLHLDQMNMVNQQYFFNTTELIHKTFDLLADKVWSAHLKDIRCDHSHMFLKWDEVRIGDGIMDYPAYLKRLAQLPPDTPG